MSFFLNYINKRISDGMQDPSERDRVWEQRLRGVKAASLSV